MGWLARRRRRPPGSQAKRIHVADPRFDDWEVVSDFGDAETARAWAQHLAEAGLEVALTADWPLDRFGRGDVALRVPGPQWSEATDLVEGLRD